MTDEDLKIKLIKYVVAVNDWADATMVYLTDPYNQECIDNLINITNTIEQAEGDIFEALDIDIDVTTEELRSML